jgi:hypothetical protein
MKTNRDKEYYLRRAAKGFKTLVIYFCVTRPQYEKAYRKDGKFSKDELMRQMDFLSNWKSKSRREKQFSAKKYAAYSKAFNYTFDIPRKLVSDVLGAYQDETGKLVRIHCDEVVDKLVADGFIEKVNHGTRGKMDEDGTYKVKAYWTNKYLLANRDFWLKLLADPRFSDYTKYPRDDEGFVLRAIRIIAKYRKQTIPQKDIQEPFEKKTFNNFSKLNKYKAQVVRGLGNEFLRGLMNAGTLQDELARAKFTQKEIDEIVPKLERAKKERMEGRLPSIENREAQKSMTPEELNKQKRAIWDDLKAQKIWSYSEIIERYAMIGMNLTPEQKDRVQKKYCEIRYGVKPNDAN